MGQWEGLGTRLALKCPGLSRVYHPKKMRYVVEDEGVENIPIQELPTITYSDSVRNVIRSYHSKTVQIVKQDS